MNTEESKNAVLRCVTLYNKCTLEWIDTCYSKELEWVEFPKQDTPQGRRGGFELFRKSAENMLKLFPDSNLNALRVVSEDDSVVLEYEWRGTAAFSILNYSAGATAKLRLISFYTLEDGLIKKQTDYYFSTS